MSIVGLIVQLVSGAVGGNVAGAALKKSSLGTVGNSIVGILGSGLGGQILGMLGVGGAGRTARGAGGLTWAPSSPAWPGVAWGAASCWPSSGPSAGR